MAFSVLILPAALLAFLRALSRDRSWREAFLCSLIFFGVAAAVFTEVLSAFQAVRREAVFLAWCAVTVAAVWRGRARPVRALCRPGLVEAVSVAGVTGIAVLVGVTALLSPPNSADAMAYHMPRVVYWAQEGTVSFFPTSYYNQIMLPPLAEYWMLHTYVLSGGDRYVNLVQFMGFLGSVAGVSLIARALGAGGRGQGIAALFCATIPNGILQASGAKNDYLLALWLVCLAYFSIRYSQEFRRSDLCFLGFSAGLALLTKGTAYLFAPALLAGVFLPVARRQWTRLGPPAAALALGVLVLNGPHYARNVGLSGSVLGFDAAHSDRKFRWRNDKHGVRPTLSNLLRNLAMHVSARSQGWNQGVYDFVVRVHAAVGANPNDPATTWPGDRFRPPHNSNHEADAPNLWHLLLLATAAAPLGWLAWRGRQKVWLWYYGGVALGFVLFCFYLKWMPWITRLHLPIFVLGSSIVGLLAERLLPVAIQAVLCLFLLNNARPFLFENWVRPLEGPNSLWRTARRDNYFSDMKQWDNRAAYERASRLTLQSGCGLVGIDISRYELEYPFQALLLEANPGMRFVHVGVNNASARYLKENPVRPCAVICFDCAGQEDSIRLYRGLGEPIRIGHFALFLDGR